VKLLTLFILFLTFFCFGQQEGIVPISNCDGALQVLQSGSYHLNLMNDEFENHFSNYSFSKQTNIRQGAWLSFQNESEGVISFEIFASQKDVGFIIFKQNKDAICSEIQSGYSEILRYLNQKDTSYIGLSDSLSSNTLAKVQLSSNTKLMIFIFSESKSKVELDLNFNFEGNQIDIDALTKVVDLRDDEFIPGYELQLIDSSTQLPVIGYITLDGNMPFKGMYTASTLIIPNNSKPLNIEIKIDAFGYMFESMKKMLKPNVTSFDTLFLDPIHAGRSINLESIQFKEGTSEFMPGATEKLNRLRAFLLMHPEYKIEIQGHVFDIGKNSISAQLMSEARAKRVMNYLKSNGVAAERMQAKGYGNKRPIFPEPKLAAEEQANRRVEIVIL
jgi:hypothetical protein